MNRAGMVPRRERPPLASRYELLVKIATGATATVYLARRIAGGAHTFSRLVAVKRPHPHLVDDVVARRALREEATVASRVHHANVAAVQDFEESEDDLLLIMDYVEGSSLAELLEAEPSRPLEPAVAVRIALDVAEGLAAVHETSDEEGRPLALLHRDVSPQNVLVGIDGTARLTDFGLARLTPTDHSRTTGQVQGKIAYVSPEYVDGAPYSVQSEVFALGVVVWEALANRRLFRGTNEADTLRRILTTEAPLLSRVASHVGPHLDAVIAKALEKEPSRRYGTVRELALALERAARSHDMVATSAAVGACVRERVGDALERRRAVLRASLAVADLERQAAGAVGETVSMVHGDLDEVANEATAVDPVEASPPSERTAVDASPLPSSPRSSESNIVLPLPPPPVPAKVTLPAPLRVLPPPPASSPNAARASRPPEPIPRDLETEEEAQTKPLPKIAVPKLPVSADSTPTVALPALTDAVAAAASAVEPPPSFPPGALPPAVLVDATPLTAAEPLTSRALAAFGTVAPPRPLTFVAIALVAFVATVIVVVSTRAPPAAEGDTSAAAPETTGPSEPSARAAPAPARTATLSIEDLPGTTVDPVVGEREQPRPAAPRPQVAPARPRPAGPSERPATAAPARAAVDEPAPAGSGLPPPNPYKNKR